DAIDVITFTSSSTVKHFFDKLTPAEKERLLARALLASIGPVTGETIRKYGRLADLEAKNATVQGLHDVIVEHYSKQADRSTGRT
ncbi:MAG TPA: uroporphyrinogen-III synthase, partial [Thermoanaerobaculia bacterium]|nr:uroporphyrinogen-III synthase [Thermoanaerobaculia bacterium]